MALLPILTYPDPILKTVSTPIEEVNDEIRQLADDMAETMYVNNGVGLAANQVGITKRIFVIDVAGEDEPSELHTFINPELSEADGQQTYPEGCLSFPGASEDIKRAATITVKALNKNGEPFEFHADGLLAVALQHENDHLNGILLIDKVGAMKRRKMSRQVQRALADRDAE